MPDENIVGKSEKAGNQQFILFPELPFNTQKTTFEHLRKLSSRIILRNARRLIRDGTLWLH